MSEQASIEELVNLIKSNVASRDAALNNPELDVDVANKYSFKATDAFAKLVELYGDAGREALCVLLEDESAAIRLSAAVFLLRYAHDDAMKVLRELEAGEGMLAMKAHYSIMNWENGVWELDLVDE